MNGRLGSIAAPTVFGQKQTFDHAFSFACEDCLFSSTSREPPPANTKSGGVMPRFKVFAAVTTLVLASHCARVTAAPETPDVANIGFVLYTKSPAPGTLNARWMYSTKYSGPGIATGGPKTGFVGKYHVRYFFDSGEFSDEYDLVIAKTGDAYQVSWVTNGKVQAIGVGMEIEDGLAVGWRRVAD